MNVNLDLTTAQRNASYDYKYRWSIIGQPNQNFKEEAHIETAEAAQPDIMRQARDFLEENGLTYVEVPHSAFLDYERSDMNFRECLEIYCKTENSKRKEQAKKDGTTPQLLDPRADVMLMGPRVKTKESATGKTATGQVQADRVVDYLGIEILVLKQTKNKKNKKSLETMDRAIHAIEGDSRTSAYKNHYWEPHKKTKFRGHKSLWLATVPDDHPELAGEEILAEIKIEHESQMDIDKLTRKFISISRAAQKLQGEIGRAISGSNSRRTAKISRDEQEKQNDFDALGGQLYDRVFTDAGMDVFMNPQTKNYSPALGLPALMGAAKATIEQHFSSENAKDLLATVSGMEMFKPLQPKAHKASTKRKQRTKKLG